MKLTTFCSSSAVVLFISVGAQAACPTPFTVKDAAGATQNVAEVDLAGNCIFPNVIRGEGGTSITTTPGGSAPTDAVSVQGIAGGTKIPVTPDALPANQSVNVSQINGQTAANGHATGSLLVENGCAGQSVANTSVTPFSLASATPLKIVTKQTGLKVYICAINLISATTQNVALIEGTLTTVDCDTSTAGLAGGTTAAAGWNLSANGGLTYGNGNGVVFKSAAVTKDVCLVSSSTGQISGSITWAQF